MAFTAARTYYFCFCDAREIINTLPESHYSALKKVVNKNFIKLKWSHINLQVFGLLFQKSPGSIVLMSWEVYRSTEVVVKMFQYVNLWSTRLTSLYEGAQERVHFGEFKDERKFPRWTLKFRHANSDSLKSNRFGILKRSPREVNILI